MERENYMDSFRVSAEIDFSNLRHNLSVIRHRAPGSRVMAMVKGNAYGHGMVTVAKHLRDVDYFGVVGIEAGIALRHSGVIQPIVLMNGFQSQKELDLLLEYRLDTVVFDFLQIKQIAQISQSPENFYLNTWIKIDTGMHRLGFQSTEVPKAYESLKACSQVKDIFFMTHFANADQEDSPRNNLKVDLSVNQQFLRFLKLTEAYPNHLKSAANSGALIQYPESYLDIIRPGIMLYGVSPCSNQSAKALGLKPVMTLKSKIISLHRLEVGERVGYGSTWRALRQTRLAVVSIGYGDGYPQLASEGTPVLIRGERAWLAGRVSMDSITVDVTDIEEVALGDEVVLWGEGLPIEEVAAAMEASPYGLLTGVTARVAMELKEIA